jgi:hypothetical protein
MRRRSLLKGMATIIALQTGLLRRLEAEAATTGACSHMRPGRTPISASLVISVLFAFYIAIEKH